MFRLSIHTALLVGALSLSGPPAKADAQLISPQEQEAWNAVGRLNKGGYRALKSCTATLVAPDLILTAAHCVPLPDADLTPYRFVAGWNRGDYAAVSEVAEVFIHPEYIRGPLTHGSVFSDIAIMRLTAPLDIAPIPFGPLPEDHEPIAFLAYRNDVPHAPTLKVRCSHQLYRTHVVYMQCPVVSGNSGAPLLELTPDGPRVVGVISAKWGSGALAVRPQDWMAELIPNLPSSNSD